MNKEEIICLVIREALFTENVEEPNTRQKEVSFDLSNEDWKEVYQELTAHVIEGLPCEWVLEHFSVPDNVRSQWKQNRIGQMASFYRLLQSQHDLCQLMKNQGIPMVILKGTAAAMYYPEPSARSMGDIDFLVAQTDYERAFRLMQDNGYRLMHAGDHPVDYHMTLEKDSFVYEIHRKPAGMLDGAEGS